MPRPGRATTSYRPSSSNRSVLFVALREAGVFADIRVVGEGVIIDIALDRPARHLVDDPPPDEDPTLHRDVEGDRLEPGRLGRDLERRVGVGETLGGLDEQAIGRGLGQPVEAIPPLGVGRGLDPRAGIRLCSSKTAAWISRPAIGLPESLSRITPSTRLSAPGRAGTWGRGR